MVGLLLIVQLSLNSTRGDAAAMSLSDLEWIGALCSNCIGLFQISDSRRIGSRTSNRSLSSPYIGLLFCCDGDIDITTGVYRESRPTATKTQHIQ